MLGNDIVDLSLAKVQSNWKRKGFLNKIFTAHEQLLIQSATKPDVMVWLFWSMKEAAYKIHNRRTGIRSFAPAGLACSVQSENGLTSGIVTVDQDTYFTESNINKEYIHTIAIPHQDDTKVKVMIYQTPNLPDHYKETFPACVSHHGQYLALVY